MPEEFDADEPENLEEPPAFFPSDSALPPEGVDFGELVQVQIQGIYAHENAGKISHFVMVTDGVRQLPIVIGTFEASSIQYGLEGARPDRPMTHDLIRNVVERLDATLDRVVIDDYWNGIFYAKLYLRRDGDEDEIEMDARPSDGIALAVRFDANIFVADGIFEAGMPS